MYNTVVSRFLLAFALNAFASSIFLAFAAELRPISDICTGFKSTFEGALVPDWPTLTAPPDVAPFGV
jgi:hypothetical protein